MRAVIKWFVIISLVLFIFNDIGSFAISYWRGSESAGQIATAAFNRFRESGMEGAAVYEARRLCNQNGFVFKKLELAGNGATLTAVSPVRGTFWMHRIPALKPYLTINISGSSN